MLVHFYISVFLVQSDLALEIVDAIDQRTSNVTIGVAISSVIIMLVFIMCPLLVKTVRTLTNDIQNYALTLAEKTKELNREKRRTDSLLYQVRVSLVENLRGLFMGWESVMLSPQTAMNAKSIQNLTA